MPTDREPAPHQLGSSGEPGEFVVAEPPPDQTTDRRQALQLAVAGAAAYALGLAPRTSDGAATPGVIRVANKKYQTVYAQRANSFLQDPNWVKETKARLAWPKAGERVPPLTIYVPDEKIDWVEAMRKAGQDARKLGLEYEIKLVSTNRWLEMINTHRQDMEIHSAAIRPERVDPSEWLVSRAYGRDYRNYGEEVLTEYDAVVEQQDRDMDPKARLTDVRKAQRILCDDFYMNQVGWGPSISEPYNSAAFTGVVPVRGFGIGSFSMFHSFLSLAPRTNRKRLIVGSTTLLSTTNIIAATNTMRNIGRMIYDRLAFLSPDLKPIPWAAESWRAVDEKTWDVTLRAGMQFHDGVPVTIHDLKFTFEFLMKYERATYWTANKFLASVEIVDEANRVLRLRFKEPYGSFETYFLQINTILPKHIWETIMAKQRTTNPLQVKIDTPIGSGPFKFGQYREDVSLQMIAHKSHFARPKLDEVWIVVTPSVDAILGRLESGEIDMVDAENVQLRPTQVAELRKHPHLTVVDTPDVNWLHLINRISVLPWRDYEFRRAWMHAFDRQYLVDVPWEGGGRAPKANTFFVDGNPWNNPDLPPLPEFNLALARQILKAAGYGWDGEGRLTYPSPSDARYRERVRRVSKPGYTWGGLTMLES
jgi:peptide/nickel transport system substrate-binding protein